MIDITSTRIAPRRMATALAAATLAITLGSAVPAPAARAAAEYEAKAAFIRNLVRFVERPGGGSGVWTLCVLGEDPFGPALDRLAGEAGGGVTLAVRRIATTQQAGSCQVVFISRSEKDRIGTIVDELRASRALTIGDSDGFAARGVVVNFFLESDELRFEVNLDAASRLGINISSKVLSLARVVRAR